MITLNELKNKANRQYEKVLKSYFSEEDLFPMLIPSSKELEKKGVGQVCQAAIFI
jgi:hypothetical protein